MATTYRDSDGGFDRRLGLAEPGTCCRSRSELEDRFPVAKTILKDPVKSVCSLPLTTAHQQLGVVNFWSEKAGAYDALIWNSHNW